MTVMWHIQVPHAAVPQVDTVRHQCQRPESQRCIRCTSSILNTPPLPLPLSLSLPLSLGVSSRAVAYLACWALHWKLSGTNLRLPHVPMAACHALSNYLCLFVGGWMRCPRLMSCPDWP